MTGPALAPPFEHCVHLDLYYPLRRRYRGAFENCRLKTLERELEELGRNPRARPEDLSLEDYAALAGRLNPA